MTMKYRDRNGVEYDLERLTSEEKDVLLHAIKMYERTDSWSEYEHKIRYRVVNVCAKVYGEEFSKHPLYEMYCDIAMNLWVRSGAVKGEISDMLVKKSE